MTAPVYVWGTDRLADMRRFYMLTRKLPHGPGWFLRLQQSFSRERYARGTGGTA
jgi:hypothetical protein